MGVICIGDEKKDETLVKLFCLNLNFLRMENIGMFAEGNSAWDTNHSLCTYYQYIMTALLEIWHSALRYLNISHKSSIRQSILNLLHAPNAANIFSLGTKYSPHFSLHGENVEYLEKWDHETQLLPVSCNHEHQSAIPHLCSAKIYADDDEEFLPWPSRGEASTLSIGIEIGLSTTKEGEFDSTNSLYQFPSLSFPCMTLS